MAIFKLIANIGFTGANQEDEYEILDDELSIMTAEEVDDELMSAAKDLAFEHLEYWWELWTPGDNCGYTKTVTEESYKNTKKILDKIKVIY